MGTLKAWVPITIRIASPRTKSSSIFRSWGVKKRLRIMILSSAEAGSIRVGPTSGKEAPTIEMREKVPRFGFSNCGFDLFQPSCL